DNILKFSASGSESLHLCVLSLPALLEQAANHVRPMAYQRNVELAIDSGGVEEIWADETKLKQVFINLLHNAVKYTAPGTRVEVRAGGEAGTFWVDVTDEGPGIPPEDRERIFEPFERGRRGQGHEP